MATPFTTQCGVAISNNYDTTGSLTKADLSTLSPEDWKALFTDGTLWNEMNAYLRSQFEMRACGIKRNAFYDWIMSSGRGMGKLVETRKMDRGASLVQPFIIGRQLSIVNDDFWAITGGGTNVPGDSTMAAITGGNRRVRVRAGYGTSYTLPMHKDYFLPGHYVYILGRSGTGEAQHGQWQIVQSVLNNGGTDVDLEIKPLNSIGSAYSDATPTNGLLIVGGNNVHDYESFCRNKVNVNPVKRVPFWYKTDRHTRRTSSLYLEVLKKLIADNSYFAEFGDIPMAERNRQDEERDQKQFINDFLFGRAYDSNQTLDLWGSLPQITSFAGTATTDPGTGNELIFYRANPIGVYDQLKGCSRWRDGLNQPYEISTFFETEIYDIVRSRKNRGRFNGTIDVYTDSTTAFEFMKAYIDYATTTLTGVTVNLNLDQLIVSGERNGFTYKRYQLFKPQGVQVNVIVVDAFDDLINSFNLLSTPLATRGRFLAVLDLGKGGSIYPAMIASNQKTFTTGEINDLAKIDAGWACVMENPTLQTRSTSKTWTAIVECPSDSLWVENFSSIVHT